MSRYELWYDCSLSRLTEPEPLSLTCCGGVIYIRLVTTRGTYIFKTQYWCIGIEYSGTTLVGDYREESRGTRSRGNWAFYTEVKTLQLQCLFVEFNPQINKFGLLWFTLSQTTEISFQIVSFCQHVFININWTRLWIQTATSTIYAGRHNNNNNCIK